MNNNNNQITIRKMASAFSDDEIEIEVPSKKFYENPDEYNFDDCKYSLLIVGPCGAGKSAFCNFLIKQKRFIESTGMMAGTEKTDYCKVQCKEGDHMLVVDCPGFCDPKKSHEEILSEIAKAAILCRGGMDAIGIVINPTNRFSESQKISYEQIELFGGNFWKHSFIIFNHEKKIQKKLKFNNADEYIEHVLNNPKCPAEFSKLLTKVENRFICVESSKRRKDEAYWSTTRDGLLAMIIQIQLNNEGLYINTVINQAKITYESLSEMWIEMRAQMESLRNEMSDQKDEIVQLQVQKESQSLYYDEQLDRLHEQYQVEIANYESTIRDLNKKKCMVM